MGGGGRADLIAATEPDYKNELHRFPQKHGSWHQMRNDEVAEIVGMKDLYEDYYQLWSSVAHGGFLAVTARFTTEGRFQPPPGMAFVDLALELSAEIITRMFWQIDKLLELGQSDRIQEALAILDLIEPKRYNERRFIIQPKVPSEITDAVVA